MTTEPKYTDAQIEEEARELDDVFYHATANMLRSLLSERQAAMQGQGGEVWRCFHCDETFTNADAATEHFGASERQNPACQIDITEYRAMESRMVRYNDEDADIHRQLYGMQNEHQQALRRAEEDGYAKGLAALQPPQPVRSVSDEDVRDAERYRWLRNDPPLELAVRRKNPNPLHGDCAFTYLDADVLDQAIDAAIAQEKQS